MNLPIPINHVLVDFENVCDIDTTILENKNVMLVLLVGAARKTLDLALVEKLLQPVIVLNHGGSRNTGGRDGGDHKRWRLPLTGNTNFVSSYS